MTSEQPTLSPCPNPWCVSTSRPLPAFASRSETWAVICGCGIRSFGRDSEAEAIIEWNGAIGAKGAPVSDWSWWVGSEEAVHEEGLYDLYEAGSREDAIGWAECHVGEGDRFHVIEARTRALQGDDEFMPFVAKRNAAVFEVNEAAVAIELRHPERRDP